MDAEIFLLIITIICAICLIYGISANIRQRKKRQQIEQAEREEKAKQQAIERAEREKEQARQEAEREKQLREYQKNKGQYEEKLKALFSGSSRPSSSILVSDTTKVAAAAILNVL